MKTGVADHVSFIPFGSLRGAGAQLTGFLGLDRLSCQSTHHMPSEVRLLSHLKVVKAKGDSVGRSGVGFVHSVNMATGKL